MQNGKDIKDYTEARKPEGTEKFLAPLFKCPAPLDKDVEDAIRKLALKTYTAIGCLDFSRVDIILDKEGTLQIRDTAVIQSPFKYSAYHEAQVAEGANLSEALQFNQLNLKERSWSEKFDWLRHLISLFAMLIIGMIFVVMVPKLVEQINSEALVKPWAKIGWGFVWLVVPPIAIIILAVTIIGLPLAIIGAAIYAIGLYMTQIFAGLLVGYWLKNNSKMAWWSKMSPLVMMSVGIIVFKILTMLPFVGGLVVFVGLLWLWGTLASVKKQLILNYR